MELRVRAVRAGSPKTLKSWRYWLQASKSVVRSFGCGLLLSTNFGVELLERAGGLLVVRST